MKIELEPTMQIVHLNGTTAARVWEGTTEHGIAIQAVIVRIAVPSGDADECKRLSELLIETPRPKADPSAFADRFIV
jgi:hypothetical protein